MQHAQQLPLDIPGARHGRFARTAAALAQHDAAQRALVAPLESGDVLQAEAALARVDELKQAVGEALVRRCVGGGR